MITRRHRHCVVQVQIPWAHSRPQITQEDGRSQRDPPPPSVTPYAAGEPYGYGANLALDPTGLHSTSTKEESELYFRFLEGDPQTESLVGGNQQVASEEIPDRTISPWKYCTMHI